MSYGIFASSLKSTDYQEPRVASKIELGAPDSIKSKVGGFPSGRSIIAHLLG